MNVFTIKDLESLSGIKAHTIRIWEQRYSFLKPQRTGTNIRYYSNDELKMVLNIALLNKYGFKISHIDKMSGEEIRQKIILLTDSQAQQERLINDLVQLMVDLDAHAFEDAIDQYIEARGTERAINNIIIPFLEKIGILWQTNHINAAQEHIVSNIIRQKLIVGIERTHSLIATSKTVLLFLPEAEHHELGLLYVYYLLKSRGINVIYLGANVPFRDLQFVIEHKRPHHIYAHITCVPSGARMEKYLSQLGVSAEAIPTVLSGNLPEALFKKIHPAIKLKKSLPEVIEYFSSIS